MRYWWQQFPTRWEREQAALAETGWEWSVDESLTEQGILGVVVHYPLPADYVSVVERAGDRAAPADAQRVLVRLLVLYPATYPFFPPGVRDVDARLRLRRHREPLAGTLCLGHSADWVTSTTAAEHLATQLPRMLAAATTPGTPPAGWEVAAAESLGRYVPEHVGARVLVDSGWHLPTPIRRGTLIVGFTGDPDSELGVGVVKLLTIGRDLVETFPDRLTMQFPVTAPGRWLRWDSTALAMSAKGIWNLTEPLLEPMRVAAGDVAAREVTAAVEVIGVLVPSEVGYRQVGEEWFFAVRHRRGPEGAWRYELRHCAWAGKQDVGTRTPASAGLADRNVLLVGTGALGGTVAGELARAGIGRLDLVDGDLVDPATACRQHAPAVFAGYAKTSVLRHHLAETSPHVEVRAHGLAVGAVHAAGEGQPDPHHRLAHLVGHADLVIDAAADPAVSRYLAALAGAREKPLLHVSATAGAYGGLVAFIPPNRAGCWWCMLHHRADHTLPFPPAAPEETATVVPVGCAEPTFTGTSADLATIAVHAARVAIDQLTTPAQRMRGNVYVAALRDHHGRPTPVRWRTRILTVHPDCPMHTLHRQPSAGQQQEAAAGGAVTAQPSAAATVTTAAGAPTRKAATARCLRTPQRTQRDLSGDSVRRGGAASESGPTGGDRPWPPETAPTPAAEEPPTSR
jgi:hypothetical protein